MFGIAGGYDEEVSILNNDNCSIPDCVSELRSDRRTKANRTAIIDFNTATALEV